MQADIVITMINAKVLFLTVASLINEQKPIPFSIIFTSGEDNVTTVLQMRYSK